MENPTTVEVIALVESKTNPRRTLDSGQERELIESIKAKGVVTPLLVRQVGEYWEIVDGARRFRAAKAAGLREVPIVVKHLNDDQAVEVQLISFTQRAGIHPLDEADAYEELRKKKFDIAQISAKVGKDRSYIARRMQLIKLIDPAKKRLRENKLPLGHALEIARLPLQYQKDALEEVEFNATLDRFREEIKWRFLLDLNEASFNKDDTSLIPKAGACSGCPKRSGNNLELFGDFSKKEDRCLDPRCYEAKSKAHSDSVAAEEKERAKETGTSSSKTLPSLERKRELYKRRLEIYGNRIEQEARLRQCKALLARLKWPIERKDFEIIVHQIEGHSQFDGTELRRLVGIKACEFIGDTKKELNVIGKFTDQQLVQFALGATLWQELIEDPLLAPEEDARLAALCSRHGVDRQKICSEVAEEMLPKKPKSPKSIKPQK